VIFEPAGIPGAFFIAPEKVEDGRGFFARAFCSREFAGRGLLSRIEQTSISFNFRAGTLRGMHWQAAPKEEARLIRCTRGAIYDVLLDLRRDSPCFTKWIAAELTGFNARAVYAPPGVAHGFQTLEGETEVLYQMSESYDPELSRGVRWNDPAFGISWPLANPILSERDRSHPLWK